jgi:hypothetical protein
MGLVKKAITGGTHVVDYLSVVQLSEVDEMW